MSDTSATKTQVRQFAHRNTALRLESSRVRRCWFAEELRSDMQTIRHSLI